MKLHYDLEDEKIEKGALKALFHRMIQRNYAKQNFHNLLFEDLYEEVRKRTGEDPTPRILTKVIFDAYHHILDSIEACKGNTQDLIQIVLKGLILPVSLTLPGWMGSPISVSAY